VDSRSRVAIEKIATLLRGGLMELLKQRRPVRRWEFVSRPKKRLPSEEGRIVSEETYWKTYYHHPDFNYEWVNGRLEEKPMSTTFTIFMYRWLLHLIECYLRVHEIASLTTLELGFKVPLPPEKKRMRDKKRVNVRKPDLGVVLNSNPVPLKLNGNRYDGIFDLCIEALSDTTKKAKERDTVEKKEEYEYVRVKEYFILDGKAIESAFYRLNRWGIYEEIKPVDGDVIRSEVLPGFQFRTSDLYQLTPPEELVKDEVYCGFVMLDYQQEKEEKEQERKEKEQALLRAELAEQEKEQQKRRAEQAEQEKEQQKRRAEQAEQEKEQQKRRAEQERKEKERLAAILKQLGISLD
jgi:hypothetical protein